jgi:ribose/xylose/arabinose/galactoside ABC-type transport system permease subunit
LDSIGSSSNLAAVADTDVAKQVLGVLQVRLLLCSSKPLSSSCLIFITAIITIPLSKPSCVFSLLLCNSLGLALLICCCFGIGFGFGIGGLLGFLTLYFGVFCSIPTLQHIAIILFIVELSSGRDGTDGRRGGRGRTVLLFICSVE